METRTIAYQVKVYFFLERDTFCRSEEYSPTQREKQNYLWEGGGGEPDYVITKSAPVWR